MATFDYSFDSYDTGDLPYFEGTNHQCDENFVGCWYPVPHSPYIQYTSIEGSVYSPINATYRLYTLNGNWQAVELLGTINLVAGEWTDFNFTILNTNFVVLELTPYSQPPSYIEVDAGRLYYDSDGPYCEGYRTMPTCTNVDCYWWGSPPSCHSEPEPGDPPQGQLRRHECIPNPIPPGQFETTAYVRGRNVGETGGLFMLRVQTPWATHYSSQQWLEQWEYTNTYSPTLDIPSTPVTVTMEILWLDGSTWVVHDTREVTVTQETSCENYVFPEDCDGDANCWYWCGNCQDTAPSDCSVLCQADCDGLTKGKSSCQYWWNNSCHDYPEPSNPTGTVTFTNTNPVVGDTLHADFTWTDSNPNQYDRYAEYRIFNPLGVLVTSGVEHNNPSGSASLEYEADMERLWHGSLLIYETDGSEIEITADIQVDPMQMECSDYGYNDCPSNCHQWCSDQTCKDTIEPCSAKNTVECCLDPCNWDTETETCSGEVTDECQQYEDQEACEGADCHWYAKTILDMINNDEKCWGTPQDVFEDNREAILIGAGLLIFLALSN